MFSFIKMGIKNSESLIRDKSKQYKIMDFLKKYKASAKWLKWVKEDFGIKIERASDKQVKKQVDKQVNPIEQVEPTEKEAEEKEAVDSLNQNLEVVINKLKLCIIHLKKR